MPLEEKFSFSESYPSSIKANKEDGVAKDLQISNALRTPSIQSVKKSVKGEQLPNLKNYGPASLGVYILRDAFARPPLPPLRQLDLSNCPFDEVGCLILQELMLQSSTLEHLNLSNCRFLNLFNKNGAFNNSRVGAENCARLLWITIYNMKNPVIAEPTLAHIQEIGVKGAELLADAIQLSHSITYLNLSRCDFQDEGGAIIFKPMSLNEVCKTLDMSHNFLYIEAAAEIGNFLKTNEVLQNLSLNWNDLYPQKEGIVKVLKGLKVNKSLETLNLSWNGLTGEQFATELRKCLRGNKTLKVVKLENNLMGNAEATALYRGIKKSSLKEIYLGGNKWYEPELLDLVKILEANNNIEVLSLGEETYLDETSYDLAQKIMSENPNMQIVFKGKIKPNPPEVVDFQNLLLDRAKFKAMSPKKKTKRRDFGHLMLKLQEMFGGCEVISPLYMGYALLCAAVDHTLTG